MTTFLYQIFFLFFLMPAILLAKVTPGIDRLLTSEFTHLLKGKRVGLVCNQTSVNKNMQHAVDILSSQAALHDFKLQTLFAPEHGIYGEQYAGDAVEDTQTAGGIKVFSLHGKTRRPTAAMLKDIDLLIFDIQDIGSRSYTFISTLFYVMEEATKAHIPVVVLDRPNPINGTVIDGPLLEDKWRSFVGYINVPYCHGMTIGELARYFNAEYNLSCALTVVPMKGWKREMSFADTGLQWIPPSPNIPEATTALYYPMTGIVGELQIVNIGVGYSLPFRVIGAPWIDAKQLSDQLNGQRYPGVFFYPIYYKPFHGRFASESCQGVLVTVTDPLKYRPVATQYLIIGMLKSLFPIPFQKALEASRDRLSMFNKINGTEEVYRIMNEEKYIVWQLRDLHQKERADFMRKREKHLLYR